MNINKVFHKNKLYCYYFSLNKVDDGLTFLSNEDEFIQVGIWKYDKGKVLPAHYHKDFYVQNIQTKNKDNILKLSFYVSKYYLDNILNPLIKNLNE